MFLSLRPARTKTWFKLKLKTIVLMKWRSRGRSACFRNFDGSLKFTAMLRV